MYSFWINAVFQVEKETGSYNLFTKEPKLYKMLTNVTSLILETFNSTKRRWVQRCRQTLLDTEKAYINKQAEYWTELVNEMVKVTNSKLSLDEPVLEAKIDSFVYKLSNTDMNKCVQYIILWKGFRNAPKTYLELENKAKKWSNRKRALIYSTKLFPNMIKASEIYADDISQKIFSNNNPKCSKRYYKILMIGFLSCLYSSEIWIPNTSIKTHSIFENNLKKQNNKQKQCDKQHSLMSYLHQRSEFLQVQ